VPDEFIDSCAVDAEGDLYCGPNQEYRVLDARASATTEAPDIVQQVKILAISPEIPNDTLSFGPDFPADLRTQIEEALLAFAAECETDENCAWNDSLGNPDHYAWNGIEPATDAEYDALRAVVDTAGIELGDL
jgi:phosphonate transport system substrate-binding protein